MQLFKKLILPITLLTAVAGIGIIIFVNYQIISAWFGKNGPADLGSIEVSYVSMARFLVDFGFKTWNPVWYFGFPVHLFYTPLLPLSEVFLHSFAGMPLWTAYRFMTGIGFILAPVSLFFLGWQLSKRVIGGLIAGMLFSVGPTLFYWLNDGVAGDKFSADFWDPRRFTILVRWGEGPHTLSLMFVPLVGVFFGKFLASLSGDRQSQKFIWLVFAAICLGLAGLTNAIGLFSSIVLLVVMAFVKLAQTPQLRKQTVSAFLITGLLALGLISFWYNLSFIHNFFAEGGGTGKMLIDLFPWGWVIGVLGICALYFIFNKILKNFALAVALLWFGIFFTVVYVYYSTGTTELLPQALRYTVESDMSLSLLVGVIFALVVDQLAKRVKILEYVGIVIGVLGVIGLIGYIQPFIPTAQKAAGKEVDISQTGEAEIAAWLKMHTDPTKGERVFLPGNYGFYLDWFTNVWQHRGALYQAEINPWPDVMHYQMAIGKNAEIAHDWLVIANAKYAVTTGAGTREMYKEMTHPERFADFEPVYDAQGDTIFAVPLKRPSLAKPVNLAQMQTLAVPKKGDDKAALTAYADWVENSSSNTTDFSMIDSDTYKITGTVGQGEGILVQMAAHAGWHAVDNLTGKSIDVKADPMSFIMLYPDAGKVDITLKHGRIWQEYLGYLVSILTVGFVVWYGVWGRMKLPLFKLLDVKVSDKNEKKDDEE